MHRCVVNRRCVEGWAAKAVGVTFILAAGPWCQSESCPPFQCLSLFALSRFWMAPPKSLQGVVGCLSQGDEAEEGRAKPGCFPGAPWGDREAHAQGFPFCDDQAGVIEPLFQRLWDCIWGSAVSWQEGEGQLALRNILWVSSALPAPYFGRVHHQPICKQKGTGPTGPMVPLHPTDVCGVSKTAPEMVQHRRRQAHH